MSYYRTAGVLFLLTALATAISVPTRLMADADATPLTDAVAQSHNLDAVEVARLEVSERLAAIGSADVPYGIGGGARLVGGLTLLVVGLYIRRAMRASQPVAITIVAVLLAASGIASSVSGASAVSLAVLAPEPQTVYVPASGESGWASLAQSGDTERQIPAVMLPDVGEVEDTLFAVRWVAGTLGFTLAGLVLVALAPVQWRMGGLLRGSAVVGAVLGVAMLFIWLDAATVVHRITGIAFLIWLILAGLWLASGRVRPPAAPLSR